MHKLLKDKLGYWSNVLESISNREHTAKEVLLAIKDDLDQWVILLDVFQDAKDKLKPGEKLEVFELQEKPDLAN